MPVFYNKRFLFVALFLLQLNVFSQDGSVSTVYNNCFDSLKVLIGENEKNTFKKAVFLTENSYTGNQMNFEKFESHISHLATIAKVWMKANALSDYHDKDSIDFHKNFGIYKILNDTVHFLDTDGTTYQLLPYTYDFTDFLGRSDWGYMFVTKLLATQKGNCHSLPYLYKILADELGATCWLSLAPNHIYIKNRCKKAGWYNTELTSGTFPIDAWITASGYVPLQAIQNGIYMDTLGNQQAIALCVLDLAKGYEFQTHNYEDGFILKCCDLVLQYHPVNVQAMLLKAETLKRIYEQRTKDKDEPLEATYQQMEQLYVRLFELGYREMPEQMYLKWLKSVSEQNGGTYENEKLKKNAPVKR